MPQGGGIRLIKDPAEFLFRIQENFNGSIIDYGSILYGGDRLDHRNLVAAFANDGLVPFLKNERFAYQQEFRILLPGRCERRFTGEYVDDAPVYDERLIPLEFSTGPLGEIVDLIPADKIAARFALE